MQSQQGLPIDHASHTEFLRQSLGAKLLLKEDSEADGEEAGWLWTDVDDAVQHYSILRGLRRPPFLDSRPIPQYSTPLKQDADCPLDSIPVLVINLQRRGDRRAFVDAHMRGSGIPFEYFDATDGATVDMAAGGWRANPHWALEQHDPTLSIIPGLMIHSHMPWWHNLKYWTRPVNQGEIGCTISHIRTWEEICRRGWPAAVVLEDDFAIAAPSWAEFVGALEELDRSGYEWDVIYLGIGIWLGDRGDEACTTTGPHQDAQSQRPTAAFSVLSFTYGTPGLVISARGARRLLDACEAFRSCLVVVDEFLPYLYNPTGHPRTKTIEHGMGGPPSLPPLVALRYRGTSTLLPNVGSTSDIDE